MSKPLRVLTAVQHRHLLAVSALASASMLLPGALRNQLGAGQHREAAHKGAEIILRTAGYTAPIRQAWQITNQANAFQNLAITASVCLCGSDGSFDSMGEAMFCNFDGTLMSAGGGRPDEIISAELRPDLVREARAHWGVENNPYQLWHRGCTAVKGGAQDCPCTFMQDMVAGRCKLPWDASVQVRDGTPCGFDAPTRSCSGAEPNPLEG